MLTDEVLTDWCGGIMREAVGKLWQEPRGVEKNLRVLMWCPELRVAWPFLDCHAALMLPALALRLALVDPFRGLVAAIWIGCRHADRLFAYG